MTEDQAHYGPGDVCPESGIWTATSHEKADIALSAGDRFPPLEEKGARWVLKLGTVDTTDPGGLEDVDDEAAAAAVHALGRTGEAAGDVESGNLHAGADVPAAVATALPSETPDTGEASMVAADGTLAGLALAVVDAARDLVTGQSRAGATASSRWARLRGAVRTYDAALTSVTPTEGFRIEP